MGAILCTLVQPKVADKSLESLESLEQRIKALEREKEDARFDGLVKHGNQMLSMMEEFKSIMDASLAPAAKRRDSMDGTGPCRLPAK
jgi:chaperonin cofactor prefoldin